MGKQLVSEAISVASTATQGEILGILQDLEIDRMMPSISQLDRLGLGWDIVRLYLRNDDIAGVESRAIVERVSKDLSDRKNKE
jgi:hypothetical protein